MNQQKHLTVLILPLFFAFSSNMAMLTSLFKPAKPTVDITIELENSKSIRIQELATIAEVDQVIDMIKEDAYHAGIKELEDITHQPYDTLRYHCDNQRNIMEYLLKTENSSITKEHDKNIPSSIYNDVIFLLKKNNIDPKNIKLKYEVSSKDSSKGDLLANAKGAEFNAQDFPDFKKPRIRLFSGLTKQSKANQLFTYQHELFHILLRHHFMRNKALLHIDNPENINIDKLISINEEEADIHAASTNLALAYAGMESRCTLGHAEIIDAEKHCDTMTIMYALMLQKEKLARTESL